MARVYSVAMKGLWEGSSLPDAILGGGKSEVHTTVHLKAISNREMFKTKIKVISGQKYHYTSYILVILLLYASSYFNNVWLLLDIRQTETYLLFYPASYNVGRSGVHWYWNGQGQKNECDTTDHGATCNWLKVHCLQSSRNILKNDLGRAKEVQKCIYICISVLLSRLFLRKKIFKIWFWDIIITSV